VLSLLWSIPGVFQAATLYAAYQMKGDESLSLWTALAWRIPEWQVWALATPAILAASRRWPVTRAPWRNAPLHFVIAMAVTTVDVAVHIEMGRALGVAFERALLFDVLPIVVLKSAFFELIIYCSVIVVDQAMAYSRRYREAQVAQAQLEARLVEAQLDALKHQLHPHFLFNTINSIAVLMRKGESAAAIRMLGGMSDLLRRSLTTMRVELVSLAEELDFIQRFLDIETTRFPDRLRVVLDIAPEAMRGSIPCMLLQPIVENAIEHGIAPRIDGGTITIEARAVGDKLRVIVRDDGVGLEPATPRHEGHGVGLSNVRKRLAQLYPDAHTFTLERGEPNGAVATLEIPFEEHVGDR
jgi:two-component system LytT family sensor kinase